MREIQFTFTGKQHSTEDTTSEINGKCMRIRDFELKLQYFQIKIVF